MAFARPAASHRADDPTHPSLAFELAAACAKPFAIPDVWHDADGDGLFTEADSYDPHDTGYHLPDAVGVQLQLDVANPSTAPAWERYTVINFPALGGETPPSSGGESLHLWMTDCAPFALVAGDSFQIEPGVLFDELVDGVEGLIARDPNATWSDETLSVQGSDFATSPRIVSIPAFDPRLRSNSSTQHVHAVKVLTVFLESTTLGRRVHVRITDVQPAETTAMHRRTWDRFKGLYRHRLP